MNSIQDQKAKRILAIQLLADTMEMYSVELESIISNTDDWFGNLKNQVKILKNNSSNLRKSGDKFFKLENEQISFGECADEIKKGIDDFLNI